MDYLQNVLLSWSKWAIIPSTLVLAYYLSMFVASGELKEKLEQYKAYVIKGYLALALLLLFLALVSPMNTPKNTVRTEPSMLERQNTLEQLQRNSEAPLRQVLTPEQRQAQREVERLCREAKQGYREMDMSLCEDN